MPDSDADLLRGSGFNSSMHSYATINNRSVHSFWHDKKALWCKLQSNDEIEGTIMLINYSAELS